MSAGPSIRRTDLWVALAASVASLVYFLSYARYGYVEDEGYLVEGVSRLLQGQLIYRDFHHTYAPGRFYLFALLLTLFGKNLVVVRAGWAVLLAAKAGLAYWVGRRLTSRPFALALAVLVTLIPGPWHKTPFTFSAFVMLFGMTYLADRPDARSHFVIGLVTGLTALLRQDVAGFGAAGIVLMAVLGALRSNEPQRVRTLWRTVGAFGLGILLVVVPVLIAFLRAGALGAMARCIVFEGMKDNRTNQLPFPNLWTVTDYGRHHRTGVVMLKGLFYLAPVVFVLTALRAVIRRVRHRADETDVLLIGALILSVGCFNQSLWRSDLPHLYQSLQPVYFLLIVLLYSFINLLGPRVRNRWIHRGLAAVLLAAPFVLIGGPILWGCNQIRDPNAFHALRAEGLYIRSVEYTGSALVRRGQSERLPLARAPLIVDPGRAAFLGAVGQYLDENTRPGESILSVPGFQLVYFLFDRRNPTRYIHVRRSLGSPEEEQAFIRDIVDGDTRVILYTEMAIDGMPERRFPVYARTVYEWILDNYRTDAVYGGLVFLKRKDAVTSPTESGGMP